MDNAAYHSHNTDMETASNTVSAIVVTSMNEAYAATSVHTSPNPAYMHQAVVSPRVDIPVATGTNMAYAATDIVTSVNEAYHPMEYSSDNTENDYAHVTEDEPEYEYPRQDSEEYY